ncbi:VOC family protein [Paucibacter sp. R3-3]|uniref:VOC family protein n=1 Tax=Roseateles agri TaxID=3098619 RepID=A0ABU5DPX4_9BURK|nr:VOC family protein [Paucibacter sp. R3-3]MDY0747690.1 VOC family protein [Paucibacter sp. R3-3]
MRNLFHSILVVAFILAGCSTGANAPTAHRASDVQSRMDHVAISVANARASAAFYRAAFGFKELRTPFGDAADVVWLDVGGGIALHVFGGRAATIANEQERHLAFAVADLASVTGFLTARGIAWQSFDGVQGALQTRPDGVHQMFFRDPDGYWVEVNDALKENTR